MTVITYLISQSGCCCFWIERFCYTCFQTVFTCWSDTCTHEIFRSWISAVM